MASPSALERRYRNTLSNYGLHSSSQIKGMTRVDAISLCEELAALIEQQMLEPRTSWEHHLGSWSGDLQMDTMQLPSNGQSPIPPDCEHASFPTTPHPPEGHPGSGGPSRLGLSRTSSATSSVFSLRVRPAVRTSRRIEKSTDEHGNRVINDYTIIEELGRGSFGQVMLGVVTQTDEPRAIKIIPKSVSKKFGRGSGDLQNIQREIAIMKKLRHKNVVSLYEVIDDPDDSKMYIIMQFVENGPVATIDPNGHCTPLPESKVKKYLRQAASGLRYMHRHHIVHRDLKPDNILLGSNETVLLSDFGVSEITDALAVPPASPTAGSTPTFDVGVTNGTKGTPSFFPPEIFKGEEIATKDGYAIDTWALGVTMYALLYGEIPFKGNSFKELSEAVINQPLVFPKNASFAQRALIGQLLNKDPKKRMTLSQFRKDPYFKVDPLDVGSLLSGLGSTQELSPTDLLSPQDSMMASLLSPDSPALIISQEDMDGAITNMGQQMPHLEILAVDRGHPSGLPRGNQRSPPPQHAFGQRGSLLQPPTSHDYLNSPTNPHNMVEEKEELSATQAYSKDCSDEDSLDGDSGTPTPNTELSDPAERSATSQRSLETVEVPIELLSPTSREIITSFVTRFRSEIPTASSTTEDRIVPSPPGSVRNSGSMRKREADGHSSNGSQRRPSTAL